MKRFFSLIFVFVLIFSVAACSKKKKEEIPGYEEQVSKEIKAEEGGTVESKDGKTSVEIPAGALDEDTTIIMTIYDASGYESEGKKVLSKVVDFEPNGTIFKKPVIIKMAAGEKVEDKTIVAAVYDEGKQDWSYSQGFYLKLGEGKNEAGDPMMMTTDEKEVTVENGKLTAAGDPIMMTNAAGDPIMTNAAGDPIMMSAAGDPIMLASAGDPIMSSAAGDPIMNAAAGDPIMMTTGHFTVYAFLVFDPRKGDEKPVEEPDKDDPVDDGDSEPVTPDDDADTASPDEDIIPEPEKIYSKAVCTGIRTCVNGTAMNSDMPQLATRNVESEANPLECPQEGDKFYGQDVQYAIRKSCVPQDFERVPKDENDDTVYQQVKDNNTGLTWLYTGNSGSFEEMSAFCSGLDYADKTWRLPTPKEFMTIVDSDSQETPVFRKLYFREFFNEEASDFWTSVESLYFCSDGSLMLKTSDTYSAMCVSGEEYGKDANYTSETVNGEEAIRDSSTNLLWQKTYVLDKTWKDALKYCEDLEYAGYSDWRLPNKNELATLLDYSKTGVLSSFPGMTANVFASSTSRGQVWSVSMKEGRIDYVLSDNGDGDEGVEPVEEGDEQEEEEYQGPLFAVRCVRSDLDPLPADGIPLCDEKIGYAPCRDASTETVWSPRIQSSGDYEDGRGEDGTTWAEIARRCREMNFNGKRQWRVPTILELRTLMKDSKLEPFGTCRVMDSCLSLEECYDESECVDENETPFESRLRDYGILVSGDAVDDSDHTYGAAWAIYTPNGALSEFYSGDGREVVARCVFDETLPDVSFPYTQNLEDGDYLVWSSMSEYELNWSDAAAYCMELEEGDSNNWRVPAMEELSRIMIENEECIEEGCAPDTKGGNSIFGDLDLLWSSSVEENADTPFVLTDFLTLRTDLYDTYAYAKVRCVRAKGEPATVEKIGYYENEAANIAWSAPSESIYFYDLSEANAYCNGLNDDGYHERTDWRVPTINELTTLVANCEHSNEQPGETVESGRMCINYSFEGYSLLKDMFTLVSSTSGDYDYYVLDFASGEIKLDSYFYGKVRCVSGVTTVLPTE